MEDISRDDLVRKYHQTLFQIAEKGVTLPSIFSFSDAFFDDNENLCLSVLPHEDGKWIEKPKRFAVSEIEILPAPESKLLEYQGSVFLYARNGQRQWKVGYCLNNSTITDLFNPLLHYCYRKYFANPEKGAAFKLVRDFSGFSRHDYFAKEIIEQLFLRDKLVRPLKQAVEELKQVKNRGLVLYETFWLALSPNSNDEFFIFSLDNLIAKVEKNRVTMINQKYRQEVLDYIKRTDSSEYSLT